MTDLHFLLIMWIYKTVFMCVRVCVCKLIYTHDLKTEKGLGKGGRLVGVRKGKEGEKGKGTGGAMWSSTRHTGKKMCL